MSLAGNLLRGALLHTRSNRAADKTILRLFTTSNLLWSNKALTENEKRVALIADTSKNS